MKKDRSYYINVDGQVARVRASEKPDKTTIEALSALVNAARNKLSNCDYCSGSGFDPYPNHDTTMRPCPKCSGV